MENKNDFTQTNETQFTNPTPQPDFQQPNQQLEPLKMCIRAYGS